MEAQLEGSGAARSKLWRCQVLWAPVTLRMGALSKAPRGRAGAGDAQAAQREMPLEGSHSPYQLPLPQQARKYQYCCQVGFWLGTAQCLQPAGEGRGSRGWQKCPGCWKGAKIRQWERGILQTCGPCTSSTAMRGSWAGTKACRPSPGLRSRQGWSPQAGLGQGRTARTACIPQAVPSPHHPPHGITLGACASHHATPWTSHGTYIWSLGPRHSSGAGKALQADLAPNPWGPFCSLCSAWTLGGIRHSTSQQGLQTRGTASAWGSPTHGQKPPGEPSACCPGSLHTRPLAGGHSG